MKKKIAILCLVLVLVSGCTKQFTINDKERNTKKNYTANIICQPQTKELKSLYINNEDKTKINIEALPECKDFNFLKSEYEGLWTTVFVKPLAWAIIKLGTFVHSYGLSIMIIGVLLRVCMIPLTAKSTMMSENMKKAKPELDKLEKKYKNNTNSDAMMKKSQEMMLIYKKYNISPLSGCLGAFVQLPLFFAFLEAVNRVPVFFEEKFLFYNLGTTPWEGIQAGNYSYIIIVLLIIVATYFAFKNLSAVTTDESQAKQMKFMNKFMIVFISVASFGLPTAIALYWIVSNGFTIVQNILLKNKMKDGGSKWKSINSKVKPKKI